MASNTGPDINTYSIPEVNLGDTFNTWRDITNTGVYKLNKIRVYDGVSSSSIGFTLAAGGTFQHYILDNVDKGITFLQPIVFQSGVTFNGDVTFNAQTFTVNANNVTIDDYIVVLGETAGTTDSTISAAGGGGVVLRRGSGNTAEWLWQTTQIHGVTGVWRSNASIGFTGTTFGLYPFNAGVLPIHGTGVRLDGGTTTDHGLQVDLTTIYESVAGITGDRVIEFSRYSPAGSTVFAEVLSGSTYGNRPFVKIRDGANRKIVTQSGHGFVFGTPVRLNGSNYVSALASNAVEAEVVGIVSKVGGNLSANEFELTFIGEIYGDFSLATENGAALTPGSTYYLSPTTSGKLVPTAPEASGTVHKALMIATSSTSAIVIPFTGGVLSSPVTLSNSSTTSARISQINQFKAGDIVRFKAYSGGVTLSYGIGVGLTSEINYPYGIYVKAQSNTAEESEVVGMVGALYGPTGTYSPVSTYESFDLIMDGFYDITGATTNWSPLVPGTVYFLNTNCVGTTGSFETATTSLSDSFSTSAGSVRKPMLVATAPYAGYLLTYRGDIRGQVGISADADINELLIRNLQSGVSGDLEIGVYDGAIGGRKTIILSAGNNKYTSTVGSTAGNVGIGNHNEWSTWNTGNNTQNRIISKLDVIGDVRVGEKLSSTPQGRDLIVARDTGDAVSGVTSSSRNVISTQYSNRNLSVGYGVRSKGSAEGWISSNPDSIAKTAFVVGVTGSGTVPYISYRGAAQASTALGADVTLTEQFSIHGSTAYFAGNVGLGVTAPSNKLELDSSGQTVIRVGANNQTYRVYMGANSNSPWIGTETNHDLRIVTNATEKMRVFSSGEVGIGTNATSTSGPLLGVSGGNVRITSNSSNTATSNASLYINNPQGTISAFFGQANEDTTAYKGNSYSGALRFNGAGVLWGDIAYYPQGRTAGFTSGAGHFRFAVSGSAVDATADAMVSVGELFSEGQIYTGSTATIRGNVALDQGDMIFWGATTNNIMFDANRNLLVGVSGNERFRITTIGSANFNVSSPSLDRAGDVNLSGALSVGAVSGSGVGAGRIVASSGNLYIQAGDNQTAGSVAPIIFSNIGAGTEWMRITNNGSVGIGTSSPGASLDVEGSVRAYANGATAEITVGTTDANKDSIIDVAYLATLTHGKTHGIRIGYNGQNALGYIENRYPVSIGNDYGAIRFRRNSGTNAAPVLSDTMTINAAGNVGIGVTGTAVGASLDVRGRVKIGNTGVIDAVSSSSILTTRGNGSNLEWGHSNTAALHTHSLGAQTGNGAGYVAFNAVAGSGTINTYTTRGNTGWVILSTGSGAPLNSLQIGAVVGGSADNQTLTPYLTVTPTGRVGIGTTVPGSSLDLRGDLFLGGDLELSPTTIAMGSAPEFRSYKNVLAFSVSADPTHAVSGSTSGTLVIEMPKSWSNTMMRANIKGFDYQTSTGNWECVVSGYNWASTPQWIYPNYTIQGKAPFRNVRFGYNSVTGKCVLLLGNTNTNWSYPKAYIDSFIAGHGNVSGWGNGWTAYISTTETNITSIVGATHNGVFHDAATDNFGIGTTGPEADLHVDGNAYATGYVGVGVTIPQMMAPIYSTSTSRLEVRGDIAIPDRGFFVNKGMTLPSAVETVIDSDEYAFISGRLSVPSGATLTVSSGGQLTVL